MEWPSGVRTATGSPPALAESELRASTFEWHPNVLVKSKRLGENSLELVLPGE